MFRTLFYAFGFLAMLYLIAHLRTEDRRQAILDACPANTPAQTCVYNAQQKEQAAREQAAAEERKAEAIRQAHIAELSAKPWSQATPSEWTEKYLYGTGPMGLTYSSLMLAIFTGAGLTFFFRWFLFRFMMPGRRH